MAITLIREPDAFMFSGNPIPVRFNCTDYLTQEGQKAKHNINLTGAIAGTEIIIKYGRNTVTMTGSATPDQSGAQFPNGTGDAAHAAQMLPYFQNNYFLNRDFNISAVGSSLVFEAKTLGPAYNLTTGTFTDHTITLTATGQIEATKPNYSVYFELYLQNETHTAYSLIYSNNLQLKYGKPGKTEIYLEELLETELLKDVYQDGPEMPLMSQLTPEPCRKSCRQYYFKYAESFGDTPAIKSLSTSSTFTVLLGALSYVGVAIINQLTLLKPDVLQSAKDRFLWQGPLQQNTRFDQPQFLYFYNSRATQANTKHQVKFYFTDETTSTKTISVFDLNAANKYALNLRFDVLHYNHIANDIALQNKKVLKYETFLETSSGAKLSETLTYVVDRSYQEQVRYFVYLSSFGSVDTLSATGKAKAGFDIEQNETNRLNPNYDSTRKGEALVFDVKLQNKFTVPTGWFKRKQDFARTRDFYASPLKYRYVNGYFLPIKITSKGVDDLIDGNGLDAHTLEYQYLFKEHAYTDGDGDEPIANNFDL